MRPDGRRDRRIKTPPEGGPRGKKDRPGRGGRGLPLLLLALALGSGCGKKPEALPPPSQAPGAPPSSVRLQDAQAAFLDLRRPYPERVEALLRLRESAPPGLPERRRLFESLREALWAEASRADQISPSPLEERSCREAMTWLAEFQDSGARVKIEFYLDRETVKRKRLSPELLRSFALLLASYPSSSESRDVLWSVFQDPREEASVRAAAMKALEAFFPKDLEDRILHLPAPQEDRWLRDLQNSLR